MIENNRNNEQIYGRNDMIMLDPNNKIYGSLGIADNYVMKTEEGTRLILNNPKLGRFGDVLTEFNMYGKSEQKQYKGINLLPPDTKGREYVEVSIPKGSPVFWITDGTPANGGNFKFFNEDKTESMWFGIDSGTTSMRTTLTIDAKYVQNLIVKNFDLSKICLGIGNKPIYEPYVGGIPSPSPEYPQEIKSVVNPIVKVTNEDGAQSKTVTLPYTLNAIPVSSGGNYTDQSGQQWICDEVDLHRGVKVQRIYNIDVDGENVKFEQAGGYANIILRGLPIALYAIGQKVFAISTFTSSSWFFNTVNGQFLYLVGADIADKINESCKKQLGKVHYVLATPIETDLTLEEIEQYKKLSTRTPTTIVENNYNTWMKATYKSTESV